ncbi:MAG: hypothetical protein JSS81_03685 [Acidobacteria bacterium]|nr:hypothetical protein [Acidobacteriota bacterium]
MTDPQILEILEVLKSLPPEKVADVKTFACMLRDRYGRSAAREESDAWTAEDLGEVVVASMNYLEEMSI